jgi:4-hydroxy-4-methyl-2-oxoglutarate aldolase
VSILDAALLDRASRLSSATMHEAAGKIGALPAGIKPLAPHFRVCGRVFPVKSPPGDNLWLHRGIAEARAADVLVVDTGSGFEYGYWGEVMTLAAQVRGIAGLVLTGGVRDSLRIIEMGFPVFSSTISIQGTAKDPNGNGSLGDPLRIGGATVAKGDLILGDADGVLVVPQSQAHQVIADSERRDRDEVRIFESLRAGKTTLEIYGLPGGLTT